MMRQRARPWVPEAQPVMEFGVFDHLDHDGQPLAAFYESRLRLIEAYDAGPAMLAILAMAADNRSGTLSDNTQGRSYPAFYRAWSTESKKRR